MLAQLLQNGCHLPDKNAAVPDVMSVLQIMPGRRQVGLLYEALRSKCLMLMACLYLIGEANIAIAGFGRGGFDANSDEVSLFSQFVGQTNRLPERFCMVNDGIC